MLQTERLVLRRFTLDDIQAYYHLMGDDEVNAFLPVLPFQTMSEAGEYLRKNYLESYVKPAGFRYAICLKTDDIPIGYVCVGDADSYDLGYGLGREHWRKGYVTEACRAVVAQVKKVGIPYVTATHDVGNSRSGDVMKRIGMHYCYSYREQWQPKNILVTFRMYQLNLDGREDRVCQKYWDMYPEHYIEEDV